MTKTDTLPPIEKLVAKYVRELEAKLRDSEAGAAAMRRILEHGITGMEELCEGNSPLGEFLAGQLERTKAALSTTAGVALLGRVRELEECLPKLLAINEHRYVCRRCLRPLKEGHAPHCDVAKAEKLVKQ